MASVLEDPSLDRQFKGHKDAVTCAHFSSNRTQLATSSADTAVMVWSLNPKARAIRLVGHTLAVTGVEFSPAGHLLASASLDRTVRLWTPSTIGTWSSAMEDDVKWVHENTRTVKKGQTAVFRAHTAAVRSVSFSPNGQQLLTASDDKSLKVWSVQKQRFIFSLKQHTNWARCARFSPDGRLIASCGDDRAVRLWDTASRQCINTFTDHGGCETYVGFNSRGTCICSSGTDSTLKIWDIRTNKLLQHYRVHSAGINCFSFHPSDNYLISASSDSTVKILDLMEGRLIYTLHGHKGPVLAVAFSPDGHLFVSGGCDSQVLMWKTNFDAFDYKEVLKRHRGRVNPDPPPHLMDIYPRAPHLHSAHSSSIEISPCVADMQSPDPHIVQLGQSLTPSTLQDGGGGLGSRRWPVGDNTWASKGPGSRQEEEEQMGAVTFPLEERSNLPSAFSSTLENIVRQLDVLTQAVSILEERLTLTEDKLRECLEQQARIFQLRAAEPEADSSSLSSSA